MENGKMRLYGDENEKSKKSFHFLLRTFSGRFRERMFIKTECGKVEKLIDSCSNTEDNPY